MKIKVLWQYDNKYPYPKGDSVVELPGGDVKYFGAFYGTHLDRPYPYMREYIPLNVLCKIGKSNIFA